MEEKKLLLRTILDSSNLNHKKEILQSTNLKDAHVYCKINSLPGNVSGPLVENFIKVKYNMKKNNASSCKGDLKHKDDNYEIKVSCGGKNHNKFNFVQLRMNHNCDYIFTAFYLDFKNIDNLGELFIFKLKKKDLKQLIKNFGSYAHGTVQKLGPITEKDLDNPKNNKEYALRPKYNDRCWNELLKFRIDESLI